MESLERLIAAYVKLRNPDFPAHKLNAALGNELAGSFSLLELDTHFSFGGQKFVSWAEEEITAMEREKEYSGADAHRPLEDAELRELMRKNPALLDMLRGRELVAHENFHVLQAISLRSAFTLAQAYRKIGYWRDYFGVMVLNNGVQFQPGECIFDAVRHIPDYETLLSATLHDLVKRVDLAQSATAPHAAGLSMIDLMEGSAYSAQKIAIRSFAVPTFNVPQDSTYTRAWQVYQSMGGRDEMAFLLACLASLRFGDLVSGYDHPVDIFVSLAKESPGLEASELGMCFGHFSKKFSLGLHDLINEGRCSFHLDIADETQMNVLERYRREASDNVNHAVDAGLEISRKIAQHIKERFESVGAKVDEEQFRASYVEEFLQAFGTSIYEQFPAANTEEFLIRFLCDENIQQKFSHCVIGAGGDAPVMKVGQMVLTGDQIRVLHDALSRFETLAMYDADKNQPLPKCCEAHPDPGDEKQYMECQNPDSLNTLMLNICDREINDLLAWLP